MKTSNISTSFSASNASANMDCTRTGVSGINFRFNDYNGMGPGQTATQQQEFTVHQRATIDGYEVNRTDRYDLTGKRLTEAKLSDKVFTEDYFAELDAMALTFAKVITSVLAQQAEMFNN